MLKFPGLYLSHAHAAAVWPLVLIGVMIGTAAVGLSALQVTGTPESVPARQPYAIAMGVPLAGND